MAFERVKSALSKIRYKVKGSSPAIYASATANRIKSGLFSPSTAPVIRSGGHSESGYDKGQTGL